jgi:hypothetical protein
MIFSIIRDNNQDNKFTDKINQTDNFTENLSKKNDIKNDSFKLIKDCIINNNDLLCNSLSGDDKFIYLRNKSMEILSNIDENSKDYYDKFNFNTRIMKKSIIQNSFNENTISTIYYLSELYQKNFILISDDKYYLISLKNNLEKEYILFNNNKYQIITNYDLSSYKKNDIKNNNNINYNLSKSYEDIFILPIKSISNYKVNDLILISKEYNIKLSSKNKKDIYVELKNYFIQNL